MTVIRQDDFIDSVADALQFISYYHPLDYIQAVHRAWEMEVNPAAKDAMAQILINSRMCAEGHRPICQDTGIVTVFLKIGMEVRWDAQLSVTEMVNEGVRRAYTHPDNVLRASILDDPAGARRNTGDNTPAVIHMEVVPGRYGGRARRGQGRRLREQVQASRCSTRRFSIVDWVVKTLPTMGAGWCPPGMLGIGIGGSAEKAAVLAKESLMDPIDINDLRRRGPANRVEELRLEIMDAVNRLGIGAQGLGGLTTVVDVKIKDYPTHAASKPVAMIPNCAATRHIALRARRQRSGAADAAEPRGLAADRPGRSPRTCVASTSTVTAEDIAPGSPATAAPVRQDAHRPRRRAQAMQD
jgi:fumarate hydratase class I